MGWGLVAPGDMKMLRSSQDYCFEATTLPELKPNPQVLVVASPGDRAACGGRGRGLLPAVMGGRGLLPAHRHILGVFWVCSSLSQQFFCTLLLAIACVHIAAAPRRLRLALVPSN